MGSGLKGICPERINGPDRLKGVKLIESNVPSISDLQLSAQLGPVVKLKSP